MSEVLERAKTHFKDRLAGKPQSLSIPEWDTVVYWKPITMKLKVELGKYIDNPFEYALQSVLSRALDDSLVKMFKPAHSLST